MGGRAQGCCPDSAVLLMDLKAEKVAYSGWWLLSLPEYRNSVCICSIQVCVMVTGLWRQMWNSCTATGAPQLAT
jgi:hypothetical protein